MKFIAAMLPLIFIGLNGFSQLNCPTFSRGGGFDRWEFSPLLGTAENFPFTEIITADNLQAGDYTNNSLAAGLIARFFIQENVALRLKGIYTSHAAKNVINIKDTTGTIVYNDEEAVSQTIFKIAPGIQWTFFLDHVSFYGGAEIPYTYYGDLTQDGNGFSHLVGDTTTAINSFHRVVPGGYAIGLGIFAGSTYYFTRFIGVGFELAAAYQYLKAGGDVTAVSQSVNGIYTFTATSTIPQSVKTFGFTPVQAALFVTIRF